jgi:hypothetical protein
MVVINFVLLNLLGLPEPHLWLYPALSDVRFERAS